MKLSQCTTSLSKFFFEFINLAEIAFVLWQMVVHVVGNVARTCQHQKFKVNLTNIFIFFLLVLFITIRRTIELDQMQLFISFHLSLVLRLLSKINIYIYKFCIIYLSSESSIFFILQTRHCSKRYEPCIKFLRPLTWTPWTNNKCIPQAKKNLRWKVQHCNSFQANCFAQHTLYDR